jgi:predicted TIM-barrel fold metal-dependent hydrolase
VEQLKNNVWIAPYYEDDVKLLAETIGVEKILFGSDWPHGEGLADPMAFTADIPQFPEFSAEDTRKVMRDNALDLLGGAGPGATVNTATGHAEPASPDSHSRRASV